MTKKYRKRYHQGSNKSLALIAIIFLVVVGVLFNVADMLSSLIVGKGSIFYNNSFESPSRTFYAISCDSFESEQDAQILAFNIRQKGGAGYVYQSGEYYVFLSMYASQLDAKSVKEKLKQENIDATIVNINIPKLKLATTPKDKCAPKLAEEFLGLFNFLYELSIEYDSGKVDYSYCIKQIIYKQKSLDYAQQYFPSSKEGIILKSKITKMIEYLKTLSLTPKDGYELNSKIKQTYFDIVFDYISLCKDIG